MKNKTKNNSGFIALISAVIISVILLLIISNSSLTGFYSRSDILDSELKEKSAALAEACTDTALLKISNNSTYNPSNEIVNVGSDTCIIKSVAYGAGQKTVNITADYNHYVTNLKIVVNSSDLAVVSWEEI